MPRLSIWFIRASLIYLLAGFTLGALMLAQDGVSYYPAIYRALPVHMEFLLVGWLVQLAMGMAFWMFPRFGWALPYSRGNQTLIWWSFFLLNTGVLLVASQLWLPLALLIGRTLEIGAVIIFVVGLWSRIKPHGAPA
ncbi:MAG TPA: hypothetical protein VLX61_15760 [Anaerolineales bacterium]|nr:hypothetical protein [Anaerolineales bacterium]